MDFDDEFCMSSGIKTSRELFSCTLLLRIPQSRPHAAAHLAARSLATLECSTTARSIAIPIRRMAYNLRLLSERDFMGRELYDSCGQDASGIIVT